MNNFLLRSGAILFVLAIIFGAFGAHALKDVVSEKALSSFEVGIRYQFYQALAFLIIGFSKDKLSFNLRPISIGMLLGISLFSTSIYLLALKEILPFSVSFCGHITPIGGLILIISLGFFILKLYKKTI